MKSSPAHPLTAPANQTLRAPMRIRVVDSAGNPEAGVPIALNFDAERFHGEGLQSTDVDGRTASYPDPYPVGPGTITFSIAGAFALSVPIDVAADTDGDGDGRIGLADVLFTMQKAAGLR